MAIKSIVGDKSLAFGKRIAKCYRYLRYFHVAEYLNDEEYDSLKTDNDEILRLLAAIVKKTKSSDSNP